eukprot:6471069-Amphidinium_carterae.1
MELRRNSVFGQEVHLKTITTDAFHDHHSTNPAGETDRLAEAACVMHMYEEDSWSSYDGLWQSSLLPLHEIVYKGVVSESSAYYSIIYRGRLAALGWACIKRGPFWFQTSGYGSLHWLVVTDINAWSVIPTRYMSPLECHRHFKQSRIGRSTCGETVSVLHWQAEHGFPHIEEASLRKLMHLLGISAASKPVDLDIPLAVHFKLQLYRQLRPDSTEYDATVAMSFAASCECPEEPYTELLSSQLLEDCLMRSDRDDLEKELADHHVASVTRDATASRVRAAAAQYKWSVAKKASKGQVASKSIAPVYKSASEHDITVMKEWLKSNGPPCMQVCGDESNQRMQIGYRGHTFARKSFSWKVRGKTECMSSALEWAWLQRLNHAGETPPWK